MRASCACSVGVGAAASTTPGSSRSEKKRGRNRRIRSGALGHGTGEPQLRRDATHCLDDERDVLVQVHTELGGAVYYILPVHTPGEGFVLHLLPHRSCLEIVETLVGTHQRGCGYQASELVHRRQRLIHA